MSYEDVNEVLEMKKWAVVGATDRTDKYGYKIFKKLKEKGREVYPISPRVTEIEGDKCYTSLHELPANVEVVNFVVNPKVGIEVVKQCKELGIKNIWLQPGTVSEEILKYAEENDINAIEACVLVMLG